MIIRLIVNRLGEEWKTFILDFKIIIFVFRIWACRFRRLWQLDRDGSSWYPLHGQYIPSNSCTPRQQPQQHQHPDSKSWLIHHIHAPWWWWLPWIPIQLLYYQYSAVICTSQQLYTQTTPATTPRQQVLTHPPHTCPLVGLVTMDTHTTTLLPVQHSNHLTQTYRKTEIYLYINCVLLWRIFEDLCQLFLNCVI